MGGEISFQPDIFVTFIVYLAFMTCLGGWLSRRIKTFKDMAIAGGRAPWYLVAGTMFGIGVGASILMGEAAYGYKFGLSTLFAVPLGVYVSYVLLAVLIFPRISRVSRSTGAEFIEDRYNRDVRTVYGVIGGISSLIVSAPFIIAISVLFGIGGIPPMYTAIAAGLCVLLYTFLAGQWAVLATDFIQTIIFSIALWVMFGFMMFKVGLSEPIAWIGANSPWHLSIFSPALVVLLVSIFIIRLMCVLDFATVWWRPAWIAKSKPDAVKGASVWASMYSLYFPLATILGLLAFFMLKAPGVLNPDQLATFTTNISVAGEDAVLPSLGFILWPRALAVFFMVAIAAGVMSTCDSILVAGGALVTNDFYRRFRPNRSERHYVWVMRGIIAAVFPILIAICYSLPGIISAMKITYGIIASIGAVAVLGLVWRRVTPKGVIAAMIFTFLWYVITWAFGMFGHWQPPIGILVGFVSVTIASLLTKPEYGAADRVGKLLDIKRLQSPTTLPDGGQVKELDMREEVK